MNDDNEALPELLLAIIQAAREMFRGDDWDTVEGHVKRAWNDISHDAGASWQQVRAAARREWDDPAA